MLTKEISYTVDITKKYNNLLNMQESVYVQDMYLSDDSVKNIHDLKDSQTSKNFYWDSTVVSMEDDEMESYFILDELGSPIELMDEDGFIRESYSYDEFGRMYTDESHQKTTPLQPFGFTGYQMDEAGGLYYAQARRYDAVNGRFVSKDSDRYVRKMQPYTWNQYLYCDNNPEKYVDPSGNVYIIFALNDGTDPDIPDGENELRALQQKDEIMQTYGLSDEDVVIVWVTNEDSFDEKFNETVNKYEYVDTVIIHTHGSENGLYGTQEAEGSSELINKDEIYKLDNSANIGKIVITACDTAHDADKNNNNFASELAKWFNETTIIASNGNVHISKEPIPRYVGQENLNNSGIDGSSDEPYGWYGFYYKDGILYYTYAGNVYCNEMELYDNYTLSSLLGLADNYNTSKE